LKPLSKRVLALEPSPTLSVAEKARKLLREGKKLVRFDVGEPGFNTPKHIVEAAIDALNKGYTHYTSSRGIHELREAISKYYKDNFNVPVDPSSEIIVTPGSKFALYAAIYSIVDEGDEVILLTPSYATYWPIIKLAGGKVVEVNCKDSFKLDEEKLKEAVSNRSKAILVNSPNNPTGGVLSKSDFKIISDIACDHDLYVISDEIYRLLVYGNLKPFTALTMDNLRNRLIVLDGFSKAWAMTGWRLGFAIAPENIISMMNKIQQNSTTCPAAFVQMAGITALLSDQSCVKKMLEEYDRRRKMLVDGLNSIGGVKCQEPKGAFYAFPDLSSLGMNSIELAENLLLEEGICTVPGSVFGPGGEGHLRLSYGSTDKIVEGIEGIRRFVERRL